MTTPASARVAEYRRRRLALRVEVEGRMVAAHLPPEMHGREGTYGNHGCQCPPCTAAWAAATRARRYRATVRKWAAAREDIF